MPPMTRFLTAALLAALVAGTAGCPAEKHEDPCPSGQTFCAGCRDPASFQTDPNNCGSCGLRCGTGTCVGGVCQCEGWTSCPGQNPRCRDTQNDPAHCGTCGLACGHGTCAGGICQCEGWVSCPGANPRCKDVQNDPVNCGSDATACGNVCPLTNDVCVGGTCQCPTSLPDTCPAGTPTKCVNLANDPQDCGTCGNTCTKTNEVCTSGSCACPDALPDTCGTACVNRATDEQNCGTCGTVCPASATCTTGTCECPAGPQSGCDGACCAGGPACCVSSCQTQHTNGLGQSFFDCGSLDEHTLEQARLAAIAWSGTGSTWEAGLSCSFCLCRQTATQAAVWCFAGSGTLKGLVQLTQSPNCLAAACPFGAAQQWH